MGEGPTSRICTRCGEKLPHVDVHLRTVMQLQRFPKEQHVDRLAAMEGLAPELAAVWVRHLYHALCEERVGHCPACQGRLRTWRAQWCPHCKHDWHEKAA